MKPNNEKYRCKGLFYVGKREGVFQFLHSSVPRLSDVFPSKSRPSKASSRSSCISTSNLPIPITEYRDDNLLYVFTLIQGGSKRYRFFE
mmetsp:Transcript_19646/g.32435  ORF Transcript_19646/g.32435 Transcript_19646/m.32435 type:complete len:89 (+) Transcript_19646:847-1113(+)